MQVGFARLQEYVVGKRLLSQDWTPEEVLSIATYKRRCVESGEYMLKGMYPMQDT